MFKEVDIFRAEQLVLKGKVAHFRMERKDTTGEVVVREPVTVVQERTRWSAARRISTGVGATQPDQYQSP